MFLLSIVLFFTPFSYYFMVSSFVARAVSDRESRSTKAKLIAQVYEVDPLECPCCHSSMNVIAVITDP
jgi:hypothetical protein